MHCVCFSGGVDIFGFIESNQISLVIIWERHYFHNYLWILPIWLWDLLRQLLGLNTFWFSWFNSWAVFTFIGSKWKKRLTEGCSDEGILYRSPKECAIVLRQYVYFLFLLLLHCFASAAFVFYHVMQCNGAFMTTVNLKDMTSKILTSKKSAFMRPARKTNMDSRSNMFPYLFVFMGTLKWIFNVV